MRFFGIGRKNCPPRKLIKWICLQHLNNLLENYLEPLKNETFLTTAEISVLFGNIVEIINFQHQFLENLNEALAAETHFYEFEHPSQFKVSILEFKNTMVCILRSQVEKLFRTFSEYPVFNWKCIFILRRPFQII